MGIDINDYKAQLNNNYTLIFTSNDVEKDAVLKILSKKQKINIPLENQGAYIGILNGEYIVHLNGTSGMQDAGSVGRIATIYINKSEIPKPRLIILVGFCWGKKTETSIGDVIISKVVYSINKRTETADGLTFTKKRNFSSLDIESDFVETIKENVECKLLLGDILSCEVLYNDTKSIDNFLADNTNIIGGEMESFGFLPSYEEYPWLVVKAVSDFGGDDYNRNSQPDAAKNAASLISPIIHELMKRKGIGETLRFDLLDRIILGTMVSFKSENVSKSSLDFYLDKDFSKLITLKLDSYGLSDSYSEEASYTLRAFILEITQNSIKHGGSKEVRVEFQKEKIILSDDGAEYGLHLLKSESESRGGVYAYKEFINAFGDNAIKSKYKNGNNYIISLGERTDYISTVQERCSVDIDFNKTLPSDCKSYYVDLRNYTMYSRVISVVDIVRPIINEGKAIYIACKNKSQEIAILKTLGDTPGDKKIFFIYS
ncbi:hypothetical protein JFQ86_00590 [Serratia ureilytica]|uniref:hypothetical protein n=1 Tax=Serratia ureilytica TaxID=300181 RepID=UPI0018E7B45B|nr:hypothetical protein [Serratia ureilytica]MBJ2111312.1 hypothetical protein [Serratia ureilytica]